jgi:hypothetical protein
MSTPLGARLRPTHLQMRQVRRVHEDHQMSYIIASLPPLKCFVRREFLYNHTKGHGELEPAIWVSIKALRGQVFRIESLLPNYGALYDKLPLHAYVWREDNDGEVDLPIDTLQLWDCMGYRFTVLEKIGLRNLGVKFLGKNKQWHHGRYLFTVDFCADGMDADTGFTEQAEEHKSFNFIRLDNGQFAAQPNNRCLWYDQSLIPAEVKFPDFQAAKDFYTVDGSRKWSAGDDWFYDLKERT